MAVTKTVLKLHQQEAVVKVAGTAASATIDLDVDLLPSSQTVGTPEVSIVGYHINAMSGATVTVTRNSVNVLTIPGPNVDTVQFNNMGFSDDIENDQDISVTIAGAEAQLYLILRKTAGYNNKIETATYGAHDDEAAVGS